MRDIILWSYVFFVALVAAALVVRLVKIVRAVRSGTKTPASASRPGAGERLRKDVRVFFEKSLAALLHTVLVVSFLSMILQAVVSLYRAVFFGVSPEAQSCGPLETLTAAFAAAAIAAAAVLLARRLFARLPRYATLTPAQRRDGYIVLVWEMASAATLLAVYDGESVGFWPSVGSEGIASACIRSLWAVYLHYGVVLTFGWYITFSKHLHIFSAPLYLASFGRRETYSPDDMPQVAHAIDLLEGSTDVPDVPSQTMGALQASDLTRGRLLSAFSCTQCGRCDAVCPPVRTGIRFSPRQTVARVRNCAMRPQEGPLYGGAISRDEAFACIACGACLEACPVAISPMDILLELRRYATLELAQAPQEYAGCAAAVVATGNPWGLTPDSSQEVLPDGTPFPTADPACPPRYLLWRGTMGLYDPQGRRAVRALAQALNAAGESWAVLPPQEERDTADILRYTGDEWTFLSSARRNIETLSRYGIREIVTPCPHSWSAFRYQYPSLGGHYRVRYAAELVLELLQQEKLSQPRTLEGRKVVYHDPCRLSRGHLVEAPRRLLDALGAERVEVAGASGTHSMCCGGGDYFRRSETPATVAALRMEQLASCGAEVVVTACPFCRQMLSQAGSAMPVVDLTECIQDGGMPAKCL